MIIFLNMGGIAVNTLYEILQSLTINKSSLFTKGK